MTGAQNVSQDLGRSSTKLFKYRLKILPIHTSVLYHKVVEPRYLVTVNPE